MLHCHSLEITIKLGNLARNFNEFRTLCPGANVAAVVKADAYGTGLDAVTRHLASHGCATFFVAHLREGTQLRQHSTVETYVLNGLLPGTEPAYKTFKLKPVLTSERQVRLWIQFCDREAWMGGAALHVDTGINRLGFRVEELGALKRLIEGRTQYFDLIMSHLACADRPSDPRNREQIETFWEVRKEFGKLRRASLAGSAGCFLGPSAHFDLVRPGIGLYGGNPFASHNNPFRQVVTVNARLLQVKTHRHGEYVGYGRAYRLEKDSLIGVISLGYADGYPRYPSLGGDRDRLQVYYKGRSAPVIGRVSMDTSIIDLSSAADLKPSLGDLVEICGPSQSLDDLAKAIGSIPNEVLTTLGSRSVRSYVGDPEFSVAAQIDDLSDPM
ncbi:alanine racemase (plasmid) [Mesorhizobium sp. 131-3-5]|uniref:alanine racemase n=1 Tax=Mesorhizobium sp. 131-3-5 TaxID=2744520 RepID=UPI0018ED851E|nr:alanine racemase [Mesorhizobium sp. 131-3-5]BCH12540.1 alanine racemase [Mesorhizobium sp. 131-3-5]